MWHHMSTCGGATAELHRRQASCSSAGRDGVAEHVAPVVLSNSSCAQLARHIEQRDTTTRHLKRTRTAKLHRALAAGMLPSNGKQSPRVAVYCRQGRSSQACNRRACVVARLAMHRCSKHPSRAWTSIKCLDRALHWQCHCEQPYDSAAGGLPPAPPAPAHAQHHTAGARQERELDDAEEATSRQRVHLRLASSGVECSVLSSCIQVHHRSLISRSCWSE